MRPWCDIELDVKPWLQIETPAHDAVLTTIRDAVEQAVVNYVEHEFEALFTQEVVDSTKSDAIAPSNWPIISVTNLYFYTGMDGTGGQLIDATQYDVRDYGVVLAPGLQSPRGRGRVRIDYTWGYDGLPADAKLMILQTIEAEFRRKGRKSIGAGGRSKKDESEGAGGDYKAWDKKTGLPLEVLGKLNTYKQGPEFTSQPMATRNW